MAGRILQAGIFALMLAVSLFATTHAAVTLSSFTARMVTDAISARVVMSWTTATEINTAGFNIYRSDHVNGPYARINAQLIPAKDDLLAGGTYTYSDDKVQAEQTYYYQLEDVELNGTSERHPPIAVNVAQAQTDNAAWLFAILGVSALGIIGASIWFARRRH